MFRDQLFAISIAPKIEPVDTPAGRAFIRSFSAGEKDKLEADVRKDPSVSFRARLIVLGCCNEDGSQAFLPGDVHRIADYPISILEPLVEAIVRLNKLSPEDVEGLEKNSTSQTSSSNTA